jgi:hypothetical protein
MKFQGAFGGWMPDLNYGKVADAAASGPFNALAETADKWMGMGVDGFRLDAVKHIYSAERGPENPAFLKLWYDRCNSTFRKTHSTDLYMVGEVWMGASEVAPYYEGLPACFEFDFWERLKWVLNQRTGCYFANDLMGYRQKYAAVRPGAIAATKLTNHDETRAATLGLPASVDAGFKYCSDSHSGQSIARKKTGETADGRPIFQDTNNTTDDYEIFDTPVVRRYGVGRPSWNTWAK